MYVKPVGISILTNGTRLEYLKTCISSLLENSFMRPLVVAVFDNGSNDNTAVWFSEIAKTKVYGIEWRFERVENDLGCAAGTNRSIEMVKDCEFVLHLESDFRHLTESESGIGKLWLRDAVDFLETGLANYIYLRRMRSEQEMAMHWFRQWRGRISEVREPFQHCENFWWSNNPSIFRVKTIYDCKTLPLNERLDGEKGTVNWSRPELSAPHPPLAWLWGFGEGMFVHDG